MPPQWPVPPATTTHISEAVFLVREHCRRVGTFAQENPKCRATAQYMGEVMGIVDDLLGRVQHENMTTNRHDAASTRAYIQHIHELLKRTRSPAGPSAERIQPPPAFSPDSFPVLPETISTAEEEQWNSHRIRIRWDSVISPYRDWAPAPLCNTMQAAIDKTELKGTLVRAARIHPSGDIDLYTDSPEDCDRLVRDWRTWTRQLPHHRRIHVVGNQFTILVHGVTRNWFSKQSLENGEAGEAILTDNAAKIPDACVLHVGWAGSKTVGKKPKGSLMVSLHRAEDANRLLRGPFYLRNQTLRTELFDPRGRVVQCLLCQRYGHVQRGCTFSTRCLYCGQQHQKADCPQIKVNPNHFTCANCDGPHPAHDRACPARLEAATEAENARKHKPKYFPEPVRPSPVVTLPPTPNPSGTDQPEASDSAKSDTETRKVRKVVETNLPTTPTPLPEEVQAVRNLRRRAITHAHEVRLTSLSQANTDTSDKSPSDRTEPTLTETSGSEQSGRSDTEAPSASENSESETDAVVKIPDREAAQQSSASDTDAQPEPPQPLSPYSSPKKRRSVRLQEEPTKRQRTTGPREIPQPTPEQRPKTRAGWTPKRKAEHAERMQKLGLTGNRRPIDSVKSYKHNATERQGEQTSPTGASSSAPARI